MVGLARSWRHMDSTSSRTAPSSSPSTSRVIKRPTRTLVTPRNPRAGRDLSTVAPCGSRMPSLGVICTETLNTPPPFLVPSTTTFPQLQLHNPAENLCICIFHTAHIPAKAILVQPLAGLHIPQTDGPRGVTPEFQLEVHQHQAPGGEKVPHHRVNPTRHLCGLRQLLPANQPQLIQVGTAEQRVTEIIILEVVLDNRRVLEIRPLLVTYPLGEGTCRDIPHHELHREHVQPADAHGRLPFSPQEVSRYTGFLQNLEEPDGDSVVHPTLGGDGTLLLAVERGGGILEILDVDIRIFRGVNDLSFTLVELVASGHLSTSSACVPGPRF